MKLLLSIFYIFLNFLKKIDNATERMFTIIIH